MLNRLLSTSKLTTVLVAASTIAAIGLAVPAAASATTAAAERSGTPSAKPTIVLVHGAWADASSFALVTAALQKDGYTVLNAPNPLRGLASDAANVAAFVNQGTTGPVVLVGHSYGGSVITDAATDTPTVKALVYINAYAPDEGESVIQLTGSKPGSALAVADPSTVLNFVQYPGAATGDVDAYVKPSLFRKILAAGLSARETDVLAASQSPVTLSALQAPSGTPAWKTIKSFFFVGTSDEAIPAALQLDMAARAGGFVVKKKADHLSMLEVPNQVADLIEKAARTE
jgi:pimeloyl-ACP methyl ester carboxylesterase